MRNPGDRPAPSLPRPWRVAIDWIVTILGAVAIVLAIKAWVVNPYRIPSSSMEPALHCAHERPDDGCLADRFSDRVLANRFIYHFTEPKRGEIIVFETPARARPDCGAGGTFVKRIIGLPGETVRVDELGQVFINDTPLREDYLSARQRGGGQTGTWPVPRGHFFVMGDNRAHSCDSRVWGALPSGNVVGEVFAVYWPLNRISLR